LAINQVTVGEAEKHNRWLFIADGVLYFSSRALFDYNVLVPAFVSHLGASSFLIGLVVSINRLGFFLPQIFVANHVAGRSYIKPVLLIGVKIYTYSLLAMIPMILLLANRAPLLAMVLFFILYSLSCAGDGIQGLPWVDILAKSIDSTRRGRLLGYMQTLGGIASFAMAGLVAWVLSRSWLSFPGNYTTLIMLAAVVSFGSIMVLGRLQEPANGNPDIRQPLRQYLCSIPAVVRVIPGFNKYLLIRGLGQSYSLASAFYVTYAIDGLGATPGLMGGFIAAQMGGVMVGGMLLGYIGDMWGTAWSVRLSLISSVISPAVALLLTFGWAGNSSSGTVTLLLLLLYFFLGATLAGLWMTFQNYLLELVDAKDRPTCIGLTNVLVAPLSFLPVIGGILVGFVGYKGLFFVTLLLILIALWLSAGMPEPRKGLCGTKKLPFTRGQKVLP
jgi:MFS family permease